MTSEERKAARRRRRDARREEKRAERPGKYDDFSRVTEPDNLYRAFKDSRRSVSWKESVQRHEMNLFARIADARNKLLAGEDVTHGFVEFDIMDRGRPRHIKSIHIAERAIQKCLCDQILVPILSRPLIYDNGASLRGKGLQFSIRRLVTHLSRYYRENRGNDGYCLLIDFSKYFDNIRHDILLDQMSKAIHDERIIKLVRDFIIPFGDGKSLGLGSQVSQIAAISYPNRLDHYIKEILHIRYYGRYMDDLYFIHRDKKYLEYCREETERICGSLGITINRKKSRIVRLRDGVHFLKGIYALTEAGRIVRRAHPGSRTRMRRKLLKFKKLTGARRMSAADVYTAYQSWRGNYLKRFDAYHTVRRMDCLYNRLFIH